MFENDNGLELDAPVSPASEAPAANAEVSAPVQASPQPGAQAAGGSAVSQEPAAPPTDQETEAQPQPRTYTEAEVRAFQAQQAAQVAAAQRQVQEAVQRANALEERQFEAQVAQLPKEQQDFFRAQRQLSQERAKVQQAATRQAEQIRALEPVFQEMVVRDLLDTYRNVGVTREALLKFNSPEAMESYCELRKTEHRARQVESRKASGADAAAASGSGAKPAAKADWRSQSLSDQLRDAFRD